MESEKRGKVRRRRWPWIAAGATLAALAALVWALPAIICAISWPELEFDLTDALGPNARLFDSRAVRVKFDVSRKDGRFAVTAAGRALDWPFSVRADIGIGWFRADGSADLTIDGTPWRARADFNAPSLREWKAAVTVPETAFDEKDPLLAPLLSRLPMPAVSNLTFAGRFALDAAADRTRRRPVPAWQAKVRVSGADAGLFAGGVPVSARGFRLTAQASGIADHVDIAPLRPHIDAVEAAGFALTNVYATVYAGERTQLVTEAGADCCGGTLRLYSLYVNPASLSSGFTLFVDSIDAGEALAHVSGFHGEATGRLHGKLQLFLRDGRTLRLRDSYVYSTPGEGGKVRIGDATPITGNLALGGVPAADCDNLAKALADLDYSVLKVDLRRESAETLALTLKLEGSATRGRTTVPVSFAVTFHGNFEQIINTGLTAMRK